MKDWIFPKKLLILAFCLLPFFSSAQVEILGKKKKFISNLKEKSILIIDTPEMSIWNNKEDAGSLFLICYFKDDQCVKTMSVYPMEKMAQWEKILNVNCTKVAGTDKVWLDQKRNMLFKILPGTNNTFALENSKSNE